MRHRKAGRKLGRNASHRRAMFRNMASALFEHEQIVTTVAKAKELRPYVEKLITIARKGAAAERQAGTLRDKASEHDKRAQDLLEEARRHGTDTDAGKRSIENRRGVLQERYKLLAEWRRAVAPVLHARRLLIARLGNHRIEDDEEHDTVVQKLIKTIGPRFSDRPGGYTRIVRLTKRRLGDAGPTALIALVTSDSTTLRQKRSAESAEPAGSGAGKRREASGE
jgi:large subunit ribosomal protein L17